MFEFFAGMLITSLLAKCCEAAHKRDTEEWST